MDCPWPVPRIEAISTAVPEADVDSLYRQWAARQIPDRQKQRLFERMSSRSGIARRYSVLGGRDGEEDGMRFYTGNHPPSTAQRMEVFAREAPALALRAIAGLPDAGDITHLVTASCTGFTAPGLDQVVARQLDLDPAVERVNIGFMGCYAGITALRTAGHIVRSQPDARVLVLPTELCTLHMQETEDLESLLAMGQFADGAAAAIVSARGEGLTLGENLSTTFVDSHELITWTIGDAGFVMHLSGAVPARLADAMIDESLRARLGNGGAIADTQAWAVHPGGKSILDAVERGLDLARDKLHASREVLRDFGNMSSVTVLFVLQRLMLHRPGSGIAMAFGPGLAMEGFRFGWTSGDAC